VHGKPVRVFFTFKVDLHEVLREALRVPLIAERSARVS
jgi:hypothetical protein